LCVFPGGRVEKIRKAIDIVDVAVLGKLPPLAGYETSPSLKLLRSPDFQGG
jgi:hypothetical protein